MVGEAYTTRRPDITRSFTRPDEFHQMFAFDLMLSPWHKESVERALDDILSILDDTGVAPAWTLNNHDTQRIVTRLGRRDAADPDSWTGNNLSQTGTDVDLEVGETRSRALIALAFALPGSLYLYQGEELGLPEVFEIPDDRRQDPVFHLTHGQGIGRDGCRIPMPWTADPETAFGFSHRDAGSISDPWLPQPADWGSRATTVQERPGTMLDLYRRLSVARRTHAVSHELHAEVIEFGAGLVALRRGTLVAVLNVTDAAIDLTTIEHDDVDIVSAARLVLATDAASSPTSIAANSTSWFVLS
jgi:alpha-glucosidase